MSPVLPGSEDFEIFLHEIEIGQCVTELEKKKQGPVIYLLLEGKAQKACKGLDTKSLNADDRIDVLTNKLKELYA